MVTMSAADLANLVQAEVAKAMAGRSFAAPAANKPAASLPKYADVVAQNPAQPTLTDQGYYVPASYGSNPKAPKD
jgi:hypothetical protein